MNDRAKENIAFLMPWQLEERLYKASAAGNKALVAVLGLQALAFETMTEYDDKALDYAHAWRAALTLHSDRSVAA